MIVIKRPIGFKILLSASNAAAYPAEISDPLNVDVYWAYTDEPQNRRYAGTYPPNSTLKIPLATDQDRDVVVTTVARSGVGVQHRNDPADAPSSVIESQREQRKPVIGIVRDATNTRLDIGVSFYPRHMRTRRITVASDAGFTSIVATYYEDVDKTSAETPRLPEIFRLIRAVPGVGTATYYVKVAHSSFSTALRMEATQQLKLEALRWGPDSDPLTVTFADSNGAGGSTGTFNPFIATIDGYGGAPSTFLLTVPLAGDLIGALTGTSNGFSNRLAIWNPDDTLKYAFSIYADPPTGRILANGYVLPSGVAVLGGTGSPEGVETAPVGSRYFQDDGTQWKKATGSGNTGWVLVPNSKDYAVHAVADFGADPTGSTDSTTALQNAVNAGAAAGRAVYVPGGVYLHTGLTLTGQVHLFGDGEEATVLYSVTNAPIVDCVGSGFFVPSVADLSVRGDKAAGTSQIGIKMDSAGDCLGGRVERVKVQTTGGTGLYVGLVFSCVFRDMFFDDCEGWSVEVNSPFQPNLYFENIYPGTISASHPAGFYVRQGQNVLFNNCNGINSVPLNSVWMIAGQKNGLYGATSDTAVSVQLMNCNIESYHSYGIRCLRNSQVTLIGKNTFARHDINSPLSAGVSNSAATIPLTGNLDTLLFPASGGNTELLVIEGANEERMIMTSRTTSAATVTRGTPAFAFTTAAIAYSCHAKGIEYDVDTVGAYPAFFAKGTISDESGIQDGVGEQKFYDKSSFFHSNEIPPAKLTGDGMTCTQSYPASTYWNSTRSRKEPLIRVGDAMTRTTITGTTTFDMPGPRWIACEFTAPGNVTLWWASWERHPKMVIVADMLGNAATNPITIGAGGGGGINGGSYVISQNFGSVVLLPDPLTGNWEVIGSYPPPASALAWTEVAVGNSSGVLSSSPDMTWDSTTFQIQKAGGNPYFAVNDTTNGINTRFGPVSVGGPDYAIIGTISNHEFWLYQNSTLVWGVDTSEHWVAGSDDGQDIGRPSSGRPRSAYFGTSLTVPRVYLGGGSASITGGSATPEGAIVAEPGSIYLRLDGSWYKKVTGSGDTGWELQTNGTANRLEGIGAAPSLGAGTGAGTSPSLSVSDNQMGCFVSVTTGASPAANATVFDLTLSVAASYYQAILQPANQAAAALSGAGQVFVDDSSAATNKVTIKSGPTALAASTVYSWYVLIMAAT